ncbi:MAG: Gfo/Idh/MocA family oxidoreductase [Verrucomicrobiales bacterium]|nr:Gfo/Idh/MocA family oxidoreductase [Verrucomicrobiales bacterium]
MDLPFRPPAPARLDWRIGVLGAGFIVSDCHLVAYRKAGFNPVAIAARRPEQARDVAERHGIRTVYSDAAALLDDPTLEVLDIAVPPAAQVPLILEACRRGTVRGILAQKPLGVDYAEAVRAVEACEAAGIVLAVNQNMRYDPSVAAGHTLLENGHLGTPVLATIDMRGIPHWMPWQRELGWVTLRIMSIHHLDCFRHWFGDPARIYCSVRPDPRTSFPHSDGIVSYILEYDSGLRCVGLDDTWTGPAKEGCPADIRITWRIEGTDGLAIGDLGWCRDPYTTPSTLRWARKGDTAFRQPAWSESWFPDAFRGTMGELLVALESGTPPALNGRDNLRTMALVEAAYRSAETHRAVALSEIDPTLSPRGPAFTAAA